MSDPVPPRRVQVLVCDGPSCGLTHDSARLKARIEAEIKGRAELAGRCTVLDFTCFGRCDEGPNLYVHTLAPGDDPHREPSAAAMDGERGLYLGNDEPRVLEILESHCVRGEPLPDAELY